MSRSFFFRSRPAAHATVAPSALLAEVREIAAAGREQPRIASRLGPLLLTIDRGGDAGAAREALAVVSADPRLVRQLDESARAPRWSPPPAWVAEAAEHLSAGGGPLATALASLHPDGRVREAAVARMLTEPCPGSAPFLVLRTCDWVRPVRDRARAGIALLLYDAPARYLPAVAPTASLVAGWSRAGFVAGQVNATLHVAPTSVLLELSRCPDRWTRRAAVSAGVIRRTLTLNELVQRAQHDTDLVIRLHAAEAAAREALWTSRHEVLRSLVDARAAPLRALGLTALVRAGQAPVVADHLADDNAIIRALARDAARRIGRDPATWYRSALDTDTPPPAGALAGLSESGTAADADLLHRWLDHPSATARAAAVRGLRQLDAVTWERLFPLLEDPVWSVARQVALTLGPLSDSLPPERLWQLLASPARSTRRAAHLLLRTRGRWTRLRAGLMLAIDHDPALARWGRLDVVRWTHDPPGVSAPPPDDIDALIDRAASGLDAATVALVRARVGAARSPHSPDQPAG